MRALLLALLCCCGGGSQPKGPEPVVIELPKPVATVEVVPREVGPGSFTMVIDFSVLRAHPAGKQLGVLIPALPVWRQTLRNSKIDVMRDCDWMSIEGPNVHDASYDVVLVHYSAPDADVESAITSLIGQRAGTSADPSLDVGEPGVRAWQLTQRRGSSAFLRPKNDHILAVVPVDKSKEWAHTLATSVVRAPHAGRAVDIRATNPNNLVPLMPAAFVDERIIVTAKGDGATLHLEGDCLDEPSATLAAAELEKGVRDRNTFAVKMATAGAFSHFQAHAKGKMVTADIDVTAEQLDSILKFTAAAEGANLPP